MAGGIVAWVSGSVDESIHDRTNSRPPLSKSSPVGCYSISCRVEAFASIWFLVEVNEDDQSCKCWPSNKTTNIKINCLSGRYDS